MLKTTTKEKLHTIPKYKGYFITKSAKVFSNKNGTLKELRFNLCRDYKVVKLYNDGVSKNFSIHSLMLTVFVEERPLGKQACHRDGNRRNNLLYNLRWDTPKNNSIDNIINGVAAKGSKNGNSVLNELQVRIIKRSSHLPVSFLSKIFKISVHTIYNILKNKVWKHIEISKLDIIR